MLILELVTDGRGGGGGRRDVSYPQIISDTVVFLHSNVSFSARMLRESRHNRIGTSELHRGFALHIPAVSAPCGTRQQSQAGLTSCAIARGPFCFTSRVKLVRVGTNLNKLALTGVAKPVSVECRCGRLQEFEGVMRKSSNWRRHSFRYL
jgi:hypothetical protein